MASSARLPSLIAAGKTSSCENISSKSKEDRSRYKDNSKFSSKVNHQQSVNNSRSNYNSKKLNNYGGYQRHNNNYMAQSKSNHPGRRNQVTQQRRDDFSSVPVDKKGIKKVNLNHLLNFTFEDDHQSGSSLRGGGAHHYRSSVARNNGTCFNKKQFIQANCQLIVKGGLDYQAYRSNVDLPIEWDHVEKINMWNEEIPCCPICLYPSMVSRITKCGHIFCYPCILHYLALDDKTWRKCPICHEAVHKKDLKSVTVHKDDVYRNQCFITMKLMKIKKGECWHATSLSPSSPHPHHLSKMERNHRFVEVTADNLLNHVIKPEIEILQCKLAIEEDEMEKEYMMEAIQLCKEREADIILQQTNKGDDVTGDDFTSCDNDDTSVKDATSSSNTVYYFYQADDGQHIYLHPLNMKVLLHQYGSYDRCPTDITARITHLEHFTINQDIRKRHRYMSHLPLSLEFRIAELDIRSPVISNETYKLYQDAFDKRNRDRKKKLRNEKRILRKVNAEEMKKQGKYPSVRIHLDNEQQFPDIHVTKPASFSVLQPTTMVDNESHNSSLVGSLENQCNTPSFAQMMKSNEQPSSSTSYVPRRTTATVTTVADDKLDDDDDPNYIPPPTYQSSFGDALTTALQQLKVKDEVATTTSGGRKKKKGKKKVLLFTTAGQQHQ